MPLSAASRRCILVVVSHLWYALKSLSARSFHVDFQFRVRVDSSVTTIRHVATYTRSPPSCKCASRWSRARDFAPIQREDLRPCRAPFFPSRRAAVPMMCRPTLSIFICAYAEATTPHAHTHTCVCMLITRGCGGRSTIRRMPRLNESAGKRGKRGEKRVAVRSNTRAHGGDRLLNSLDY